MNNIRKVVLVGNGFDLAHNLKTSYRDFVDRCVSEPCILKFKQLVENYCNNRYKNEEWFQFEKYIEEITREIFQKNFKDGLDKKDYLLIEQEQEDCNDVFLQVAELLKKYLIEEGNGKAFDKLESIERVIDQDTFVISFNYTETVKAYTNSYEYIHGSIVDDNHIILGCAKGELPDAATGTYAKYLKSRQIEELNFRRYLVDNNIPNREKLLKEIQPHIESLYSGRGEYHFPDKKMLCILKKFQTSRPIINYAKQNNYEVVKQEYDFSNVGEIVIAGHSLETDLWYISGIFSYASNIKRIRIFTYNGELDEEINRKVKVLQELIESAGVEIIIDSY